MTTQKFLTDLHEASVAKYAGYAVRWLPNERQWVVADPGDLDDLFADVHSGAQTISNAITLLKVYDELRQIKGGTTEPAVTITTPHGDKQELVKVNIPTVPGKTWVTHDIPTAAILSLRGYELLDIDVSNPNNVDYCFAWDRDLMNIVSAFNRKGLLVEPHLFELAEYEMRKKLRQARG